MISKTVCDLNAVLLENTSEMLWFKPLVIFNLHDPKQQPTPIKCFLSFKVFSNDKFPIKITPEVTEF